MSFPRAKIQRFNDGASDTPAPGSYDPKFGSKVKGAVMEKSGRFVEKPAMDGESPATVTKASSMNCLPVFRTPQLPRKGVKAPTKGSAKKAGDKKDGSEKEALHSRELFSSSESLDISPLKSQLEEMMGELNVARENCRTLEGTISAQLESMRALEQDNESLREGLQLAYTHHHASLAEFDKQSHDWLRDLKDISSMMDVGAFGFHEDLVKAREELTKTLAINTDLELKISQKQQMILLLQGELSSSEVELLECKSECERMIAKISSEKNSLHDSLEELKTKNEEELKEMCYQIETLRNNLADERALQENFRVSLAEKNDELEEMKTSYGNLQAECESLKGLHKTEILELTRGYEARLSHVCLALEEGLKKFRNSGAGLKGACNEKLQALEARLSHVYEKAKTHWEKEMGRLRKQMKSKVEELQTEVVVLKAANDANSQAATARIKEVEREARIITEKLLQAEEEIRRTTAARDSFRVSNMEHKLAIVELQDKLDSLKVENDAVKEKLADAVKDRDQLKSRSKMLEVGNHNLSQSLEALKCRLLESESDVERIGEQKESLEVEVAHARRELAIARENLEIQRASLAEMEAANLQQIEEVRTDLLRKVESLKLKVKLNSETNHHLEVLKRDFQELSVYASVLERQTEEQECRLKLLEDMEKKLHEARVHVTLQEDAYNTLSANFNKRSAELQHCQSELAIAQNKMAAQEEQILEFKCTMEQLSADVEGSEMKIVELNEVVTGLEETTAEQEKEIEALNEKLDHQRDCAKAATQQIANLSNELECHKNFSHQATEHLMSLTNTNTEQQKQIVCLTTEVEELRGEAREMDCRLKDLSFELTTTQQSLREAVDQVRVLERELDTKEGQLDEFRSRYERQCGDCEGHAAALAELENEKAKLTARVNRLENRVEELDTSRHTAEARAKELQVLLTAEQEKEADWRQRFQEISSLIGPFKEQLEASRADCQFLEQEKGEVVNEIRKLAQQYADILGHHNHKQKIRYIQKMKEENFQLKEEVQKLKRTVDKLQKERVASKTLKSTITSSSKGKENHTPSAKSLPSSPSAKPFSQKNAA